MFSSQIRWQTLYHKQQIILLSVLFFNANLHWKGSYLEMSNTFIWITSTIVTYFWIFYTWKQFLYIHKLLLCCRLTILEKMTMHKRSRSMSQYITIKHGSLYLWWVTLISDIVQTKLKRLHILVSSWNKHTMGDKKRTYFVLSDKQRLKSYTHIT